VSMTAIKRLKISFIEFSIFSLYLELLYKYCSPIRLRIHPGPRWRFQICQIFRIGWLGHLQRVIDHRTPKRILSEGMYGTKKRGRRWNSWITDVEEDSRKMSVQPWRVKARDRLDWKRIVLEAKVHSGL